MKKELISGLLVAGLAVGCSGESTPHKADQLKLTVERTTYPYDPAEAGPKGSGDLGQSETPLKLGSHVVADCIHIPESKNPRAQAIKLAVGEFAGMLVPLQVYPVVNGEIANERVNVFNLSPDEIRDQLDFC
jgi:hypothetical protein